MNQGKMMLPLVPEDAAPAVYGMSMLGGNRIWSIGAYTEYPELCMEILNYLFTPEGAMTIWYGLPGLMWYDENGYPALPSRTEVQPRRTLRSPAASNGPAVDRQTYTLGAIILVRADRQARPG